MGAKDINEPSSIFYKWANSDIEILTKEEMIKKLAMNQINSNCKEALFYCTCKTYRLESIWHTLFDTVFVKFHLDNDIEITEEMYF